MSELKPLPSCDALIIGYDGSKDSDKSCLAVGRINGVGMQISKLYYGDEADTIYRILTEAEAIEAWNRREKGGAE